ncbi:MAG: hypothetical protein KIT84_32050 [Labilithrix sp.]|nr:hypothetical protein [Labilithrix sp.]MCW5815705.1 hypothetical protein [Labilithrix sp.]
MRWLAIAVAAITAGCSLLVSTDGLRDGPAAVGPEAGALDIADVPSPEDAGADDATPSVEAGVDAGPTEPPGLIGKWTFDDGTASDASEKGHHGTLTGSAKVGDTDRGKALVLDGGGAMRVTALDGAAFPPSGTLSIWFRYEEIAVDVEQVLFDDWDRNRHHLMLRHADNDPANEIQLALMPRSGPYVAEIYFVLSEKTWHHLVITWDADAGRLSAYQGGKISRDQYKAAFTPREQRVRLGTRLIGAIDDVRLFDRPLTDEEALALP